MDGNFYGTTRRGGPSNEGTLFRMTPSGTVTILHTFTNLVDGAAPQGPLIQATDGNFYGTATGDGSGPPGFGTIFRMAPSGTVTTLHAFTGHDGCYPSASVIQATDGNLYGTTPFCGASGTGVVFRLSVTVKRQPSDFDGDGKADVTVYRPSAGTWFILNSSTNYTTSNRYQWGVSTDVPVPGDYDGDGKADVAAYRPSTGEWFIHRSSDGGLTYGSWGARASAGLGDIPVPGDYDGDGKTDFAIYRASTGEWFIHRSSDGGLTYGSWGTRGSAGLGDIPVPGDYEGDGMIDPAVYRPSTGQWFILKSSTNCTTSFVVAWGSRTDMPINKRP
jgi:uncharacterized repeat protein (TIGR03803 family)